MIIKIPDATIIVDEKPVAKDIKINIAPGPQIRVIVDLFDQKDNSRIIPLDLVVYSIVPRIEKVTNIAIAIDGVERNNNISMTLNINFNLLHKELKLIGNLRSPKKALKINRILQSFSQVPSIMQELTKLV